MTNQPTTTSVSQNSRGVKQAPFVVLQGVQMPSSLVEIGFITNPGEARALRSRAGRKAVVAALVRAVHAFGRRYDALHRGSAPGAPGPAKSVGGNTP